METSRRPCGVAPNGLKIHVWTVRFCPWAHRSNNNNRSSYRAARIALGMSPEAADRLSDNIAAIGRRLAKGQVTARGAVRLANQATRSALGGAP